MNKYTFDDWWEGKIYFIYARVSYPADGNDIPLAVQWDDIIEADIPKIKKKQKELFEKERRELFKKWCKIFSKKYDNSEIKEHFLYDEIADFTDLLFNRDITPHVYEGNYIFRNHEFYIYKNQLNIIQKYAMDVIKSGSKIEYDFIHSPNFKYPKKDVIAPAPVYAHSVWDYIKWLKMFKTENNNEKQSGGDKLVDGALTEIVVKTDKNREIPIGDYISEAEAKRVFNKSTTWFWNKRRNGLPFLKIGGSVYYSITDIKKYFEMGNPPFLKK